MIPRPPPDPDKLKNLTLLPFYVAVGTCAIAAGNAIVDRRWSDACVFLAVGATATGLGAVAMLAVAIRCIVSRLEDRDGDPASGSKSDHIWN